MGVLKSGRRKGKNGKGESEGRSREDKRLKFWSSSKNEPAVALRAMAGRHLRRSASFSLRHGFGLTGWRAGMGTRCRVKVRVRVRVKVILLRARLRRTGGGAEGEGRKAEMAQGVERRSYRTAERRSERKSGKRKAESGGRKTKSGRRKAESENGGTVITVKQSDCSTVSRWHRLPAVADLADIA
jgi:hypothetical protein